jgi:L-asparagine oxygenase
MHAMQLPRKNQPFSLEFSLVPEDADRLRGLTPHFSPYRHPERFLVSTRQGIGALPAELLLDLNRVKNDPAHPGWFLIRNCPVDHELPPTPRRGKRPTRKSTFVSEFTLLTAAVALGEPYAMADEKDGELVHQVCAVKGKKTERSSSGWQVPLEEHTERSFVPHPPDMLALLCLTPGKADAETYVASASQACRVMAPEQVAELWRPSYRFRPGRSSAPRGKVIWSEPRPIFTGMPDSPHVCVDFNAMKAQTLPAGRALEAFRHALRAVRVTYRLRKGDYLLLHNCKVVHSRSPFSPEFKTGFVRWLQRTYILFDPWARRPTVRGLRTY